VLLLDEPFTGLDRRGRKWVNEFLAAFKARGGAAVVATHSFGGGLGVADRVGILAGGRLLLERASTDLSAAELHRLYESLTDSVEDAQ
jgi:ABC-type multidrug transport system ATPase subunit